MERVDASAEGFAQDWQRDLARRRESNRRLRWALGIALLLVFVLGIVLAMLHAQSEGVEVEPTTYLVPFLYLLLGLGALLFIRAKWHNLAIRRVELVDDHGRILGFVGSEAGGPVITLLDGAGRRRLELGVLPNGEPHLSFYDERGERRPGTVE